MFFSSSSSSLQHDEIETVATDATAATTSAVTPSQSTEPVMMTKNGNNVGAPEDNQVVYGQGPITDTMEEEGYRTKNGWV